MLVYTYIDEETKQKEKKEIATFGKIINAVVTKIASSCWALLNKNKLKKIQTP